MGKLHGNFKPKYEQDCLPYVKEQCQRNVLLSRHWLHSKLDASCLINTYTRSPLIKKILSPIVLKPERIINDLYPKYQTDPWVYEGVWSWHKAKIIFGGIESFSLKYFSFIWIIAFYPNSNHKTFETVLHKYEILQIPFVHTGSNDVGLYTCDKSYTN